MTTLKVPVGPHDHVHGREDAEVTLVEYGDFECPHCGRAYPIVKQVQKHVGDRLRFVFRNFPLSEIHPNAVTAAETAEFAGENGKFWQMHDRLFENQQYFGPETFQRLVQGLELSTSSWEEALEKGVYDDRVRGDFRGGVRSGVNGTPTFFINGKRHDGPFDFDILVAAIERVSAATGL